MNPWGNDAANTGANLPAGGGGGGGGMDASSLTPGAFNPANQLQNPVAGAATIDPSVAFLSSGPGPSAAQQRMFNGGGPGAPNGPGARNMSPGFHTPSSVIPSKRPRPGPDDGSGVGGTPGSGGMGMAAMHGGGFPPEMGMMMSPRNGNVGSPSIPGGGDFGGAASFMNQQAMGAGQGQSQPPTPFGHLQSSANAHASPIPGQGDFDPSSVAAAQHRLSNASPFSPAHMNMATLGGQMQDLPATSNAGMLGSEHGSRHNTPGNASFTSGMTFPPSQANIMPGAGPSPAGGMGISPGMQASQYIPNVGGAAGLGGTVNMPSTGGPGGFNSPAAAAAMNAPGLTPQQRQQKLYQLQLQNQARQLQAAQAVTAAAGGHPPNAVPGTPGGPGVGAGMPPRAQNAAAAAAAMGMPIGMGPGMGGSGGGMSGMPGTGAGPLGMSPAMISNPAMGGQGGGPGTPMSGPMNPQLAAMRQAQAANMAKMQQQQNTPENFIRMLQRFMNSKRQPLDPFPVVCGRPITLLQLWSIVMRIGGSKKVTAQNAWPMVAGQLGLNPAQYQNAHAEVRDVFLRNLGAYEVAVISQQMKFADPNQYRQQAAQVQRVQQQQHQQKQQQLQQAQRQQHQQQQQQQQQQTQSRQGSQTPKQQMQQAQAQAQAQHQQQQQQRRQAQGSPMPKRQQHQQQPSPFPSQQFQMAGQLQQPQGPGAAMPRDSPAITTTTTGSMNGSGNAFYPTSGASNQGTPIPKQLHGTSRASSLSRPPPGPGMPSPMNDYQQQERQKQQQLQVPPQQNSPSPVPPEAKASPSRAESVVGKAGVAISRPPSAASHDALAAGPSPQVAPAPSNRKPIQDPFVPKVLPETATHGPVVVDEAIAVGEEIARLKPTVPRFMELGVIDIHALTMSIRSGIHAEMRHALDTLATVTSEPGVSVALEYCPELIEALVECGEDQAEILAENAAEIEVSADAMVLSPYEDIVRGCNVETVGLRESAEFGSLDYDLDRAVDRLICVTSILRNFSFSEPNFGVLCAPSVTKFIAGVIQVMGTRNMLLRTHQNTLDLMKDLLVFLSNVAHMIQIPGRDEAFCLLVFLLAFAPTTTDEGVQAAEAEKGAVEVEETAEGAKEKDKGAAASQTTPQPSVEKNNIATSSKPSDNKVIFASYNPSVHRYLPLAVDALAKLLARDDPNRTYLKTIFANDSAAAHALEQHYIPDLLTRTFMLAIAPLPSAQLSASLASPQVLMLIEFRKPLLMQSLLAADVLASMLPMVAGGTGAPAYVFKMARSWLGGADGWASSLGRIVALLLETLEKSPAASVNGMGVKQGMKGHEAVMAPPQAGMPYGTLASQPNVQQQMQDEPSSTLVSLVNRGLAILRRLAECAQTVTRKHANADVDGDHAMDEDQEDGGQDENDEETADTLSQDNSKTLVNATASSRPNVPLSVFPRKERVVAALLTSHVDPSTLNNLCDLARIGVI